MPRYMSLTKLRECLDDARAFGAAYGDWEITKHLEKAVQAAEFHEPVVPKKKCLNCGESMGMERKNYCCFDCAEEDGAVSK